MCRIAPEAALGDHEARVIPGSALHILGKQLSVCFLSVPIRQRKRQLKLNFLAASHVPPSVTDELKSDNWEELSLLTKFPQSYSQPSLYYIYRAAKASRHVS